MTGEDRAISTVVDVSLALLLVGVSIAVIGMHFAEQPQQHHPEDAHETASMLAGTSAKIQFSIQPITGDSEFPNTTLAVGSSDFTRDRHGSPLKLLADAAVTEMQIDGTHLTSAGTNYDSAISGEVRNRLTEAGISNAHVVALWRPYADASIVGKARAGPRPPGDAEVSITVINISSGIPPVDDGAVESAYRSGNPSTKYQEAARPIAHSIVEGWLPPAKTQLALEKEGLPRDQAVYRYNRFKSILESHGHTVDYSVIFSVPGGFDPKYTDSMYADADKANEAIVEALTAYIGQDMRSAYDSSLSAETLGDRVSTGTVQIVIKTWSE